MAGFTYKLYAMYVQKSYDKHNQGHHMSREHQIAWNNYNRIYMASFYTF